MNDAQAGDAHDRARSRRARRGLLPSALAGAVVLILIALSGPASDEAGAPEPVAPGRSGPEGPVPPEAASGRLAPEISTVTDAAYLAPEWLVLDGPARRVHRIDASGRPTGSFGREGDGPGEFRHPIALAALGDTVVVAEAGGGRLHLLTPEGELLDRIEPTVPGCRTPFVLDAEAADHGTALLLRCPERSGGTTVVAAVVAPGGHVRVLGRWPGSRIGAARSAFSRPLLGAGGSVVVVGRQDRRCVQVLPPGTEAGVVSVERCLPPRPQIPVDPEVRSSLRAHFDGLEDRTGVRVRVPDVHPPIYGLHVSGGEPVAVAPAPEDRLELRVVGRPAPGVTLVPWHGLHLSDTSILQFHEELHGVRFRIIRFSPR